jgi:fructoselysine-6-P-deglycase FrlB-like protein
VAAADRARERGARLVSVCSEPDTPLGRLGHTTLTYGSDRTITPAKQILLLGLVIDLLHEADGRADLDELEQGLVSLPCALREALEDSEAALAEIARRLDVRRPVWVVAAGPNLGAAYTMSVCYLVEMQWMPSAHFAAGDYFHGPFELLTADAQLLLFAGEDATRPETDRVERFARRFITAPNVIDSTSLRLTGVPAGARGTLAGIALGVLGSRLLDHLEATRGHDQSVRRYMHKVEY